MSPSSRQWNVVLLVVGVLIVLGSVFSAMYFVRNLAQEERNKVELWLSAQIALSSIAEESAADCDFTLHSQILSNNTTIPLVLVGPYGDILGGRNFGDHHDEDSLFLAGVVAKQEAAGFEPFMLGETKLYYLESKLLQRLRYFPFVQLALIAAFVFLGYLGINSSRRAEQNRVWVGMAKETAHQLGTPISAIMAWVEYLRAEYPDNPELNEVADELTQDVDRLQLVADRFNKIGSTPELMPIDAADLLEPIYAYMARRAPRKVNFELQIEEAVLGHNLAVNRHLFDWVLENLIRNALDAMDGVGQMVLSAHLDGKVVEINVSDSGKGIAPAKFKTVFVPGYTTKARGWGLGLSLAKRIVEQYHGGKIFVKESTVGKGSVFAIRVPVVG